MIIKCEYRHNGYERADYKTHKKHCIENPSAMNRKQTTTMQPRSNQNQAISHGIVCIPCGTSLQPIDLPNWLNHTVNWFNIDYSIAINSFYIAIMS
ncbi:unnamed protein product [Rotaria magnacalcarata]|uniref:Uncharacterized protein n=1 Tax=Rotaria magnacalcarata TaxID=392030 RepID=A0A816M046_9BILA|nr:unnamed protein product [Rotaria magnacalcarata]CAF1328878.1 unnamed protein product [Rotaria magnacalcarata]CAF1959062.1 unnamed protein product [Rotaria magnacalcarata]